MYDSALSRDAADVLSQLFARFREVPRGRRRLKTEPIALSPNLLANLRQFASVPSPHQLRALRSRLSLTIGGTFKVFGYRLDSMRKVEFTLNPERTRFVEAYPFNRDRAVDLPGSLGEEGVFQRSAFLSELVPRWQQEMPIRAIRGPYWQRRGFMYAQLGTSDTLAMPRVPPGSFLAIQPVEEMERQRPDPKRLYFLQHGSGYFCCGCMARHGRLSLITHDRSYPGPYEFLYPGQIRIVGRVTSFGACLPVATAETAGVVHRGHRPAPLILPWEHISLPELISAERLRFGITETQLERASQILEARLGAGISARTLRRYELEKERVPRTPVLLALALVHSLRFTDVLRILRLWTDESEDYSLNMLMTVENSDDLPSVFHSADTPDPLPQWLSLLDEWGEWPTLLSMAIPDLGRWGRRILRLNQSASFAGLDPLIGPHATVVIDEHTRLLPEPMDRHRQNWERPLYVLRQEGNIYCGFLEVDGTYFILVPHPSAGTVPRLAFRRTRAEILGRVIGVASPL